MEGTPQQPLNDEENKEAVVRKLSKTVMHASQKNKGQLFDRLTSKNAEKITELSKGKPIFYEDKKDAPREVNIDDELASVLPTEFFDDPTGWIESQSNIDRGTKDGLPNDESINALWSFPYDMSKVKSFSVEMPDGAEKTYVVKRVKKENLDETATAKIAYEKGIPTPKVVGEISDRGNNYAIYEYIPGIQLSDAIERRRKQIINVIRTDIITASYDILNASEHQIDSKIDLYFPKGIVPERVRDRFKALWDKAYDDITNATVIEKLTPPTSYDFCYMHGVRLKTIDEMVSKARKFALNPYIDKAMNVLGYTDLITYIDTLKKVPGDDIDSFGNKMTWKVQELRKPWYQKIDSEIRKFVLGFDYDEELQKIKSLTTKSGIEHGDFESRNILVPWNFETNFPTKPKKGEPKMYIIDWERASLKKEENE